MAPSQAVAVEAPLREVLGAVAGFLVGCGLPRTAALLRQEAPLAEPTADVLLEEAKRLTSVLQDVTMEAAGGGKENIEPPRSGDEAWVDDILAKALASGVIRESAGPNLAQSLERTLAKDVQAAATAGYAAAAEPKAAAAAESPAKDGAPAAEAAVMPTPPAPAAPPPPPSAHYDASRPAAPLDDGFADEYRDDGDPGYRVLAISEMELLAELHEAYRIAFSEVQQQVAGAGGVDAATAIQNESESSIVLGEAQTAAAEAARADAGMTDELLAATSPEAAPVPNDELSTITTAQPDLATERPSANEQQHEDAVSSTASAQAESAMSNAAQVAMLQAHNQAVAESQMAMSTAAQNAMLMAQQHCAQGATDDPAQNAMLLAQQWQAQALPANAEQVFMPHVLASSRKKAKKRRGPAYRYAPSGDDFYPAEMDGVVFDSFPLRVIFERDRTGFEESKEFPIQQGSIIAARYQVINYLGSAAFSRAVHCLDLQRNEMVCMKIIKNEKDFVDQSLDEIKLLKLINTNTDNIDDKYCIRLIDYFYHKEHLIIVTELLRENLYEFSKYIRTHGEAPYFTLGRLQMISRQLLIALDYIHGLWLIHSDLKPENILIQSYSRCLVKLIDFGSSCFIDDHLSSYVQSRSYRAPEVLLGHSYGQKIDIWSLGCVIAELWTGYVLFQNDSVQSLLARVMGIIGPFPQTILSGGRFVQNYFTQDGRLYKEMEVEIPPGVDVGPPEMIRRIQLMLPKRSSLKQRMRCDDELFIEFLTYLLKIDPAERPTAQEALNHPFLTPGLYTDGL